ncbi:hypothetical protein K438DRAFT_1993197 [Mycena galopus ATCC 62051]|nr:hypothetical protein K438DRAFT_1993197 [Mycena galopus ATCC 62051]
MAFTLFPSAALQALIASLHFIGVTILTFFISRRLLRDGLTSLQAWARLSWPRLCILLVFIDSYLFLFASGILVFGVGLQRNTTSCAAGIYICVIFYTSSKVLIYSFLAEKVYTVWDTGRSRLRSPVFLLCMATLFLYGAIIIIVLIGRVAEFRAGDGACIIGLKRMASLPLLSYDLFINILLTTLFLWPLLRSRHPNVQLRRLAIRTLFAAGMALTTSTVNIAVLTIMKGRQLGWLCLASCGIDVIFNAVALFWVTGGSSQNSLSGSSPNRDISTTLSVSGPPNPAHSSLKSPPTSPLRSSFKSGPGSPLRSKFKQDVDSAGMFKMLPLSSNTKEFQIHVTTQSHMHISSGPADPTSLSQTSETDSK